jgi:hypothetical protein
VNEIQEEQVFSSSEDEFETAEPLSSHGLKVPAGE